MEAESKKKTQMLWKRDDMTSIFYPKKSTRFDAQTLKAPISEN